MSEDGKLVCVFSGSLVEVNFMRARLDEFGLESMRREVDYSRLLGCVPPVGLEGVQLIVNEEDADKAFNFIVKLKEAK